MRRAAAAALLVAALGLVACGDDDSSGGSSSFAAEAGHIHGLGVDPRDSALFIATHAGLFRAAPDSTTPVRVGAGSQDTMGFTIAGPGHFFGSGHPAPGEPGPPNLGLIESRDAGQSWREVSLGGRADFHVLRYVNGTIYGYNGLTGRLMISADRGGSWQSSTVPAPLFDLAVDPDDSDRIIATSEAGLIEKPGETAWRPRGDRAGLLAWPTDGPLYLVEGDGKVSTSETAGQSWRARGALPEAPVALTATAPGELYVALQSGTIMRSVDGGRQWTPRVRP